MLGLIVPLPSRPRSLKPGRSAPQHQASLLCVTPQAWPNPALTEAKRMVVTAIDAAPLTPPLVAVTRADPRASPVTTAQFTGHNSAFGPIVATAVLLLAQVTARL